MQSDLPDCICWKLSERKINMMKGSNISRRILIGVLLSVIMIGISPSFGKLQEKAPRISITPDRIPETGFGYPGDEYSMTVNIEDAPFNSTWAVEIVVDYAPYLSVMSPFDIEEGSFMSTLWPWGTWFIRRIDHFQGILKVAIARRDPSDPAVPWEGASGSGELLTFKFKILEAGKYPIDVIDCIIVDPDGNSLIPKTSGSYYYGSTAELTKAKIAGGRKMTAGEVFHINSKVKNEGDVPLWVRTRFEITRIEDSRRIRVYSGQNYTGGGLDEPLPYTYLYVDEFNETDYEWLGDPGNLLDEPDGSYIEGNAHCQWAEVYSFEDINLAGRVIDDIFLEGYTQYPNGSNEDVDIDVFGSSSETSLKWLGSLWGTPTWDWHWTRWTMYSVLESMPELANETELNNLEISVHNYHGDTPNVIRLDSMRLKVEFATIVPKTPPEYLVNPGEDLELEPVTWFTDMDQVGCYEITATVEYPSAHYQWNSWCSKQETFDFWILPPKSKGKIVIVPR